MLHQLLRTSVQQQLVRENYLRKKPSKQRGYLRCGFYGSGTFSYCNATFSNKIDMQAHNQNCVAGIMQQCKHPDCQLNHGQIFHDPLDFAAHAVTTHDIRTILGNSANDICIMLDEELLKPVKDGYNLRLLKNFQLEIETQNIGILLGVVVQNLGDDDRRLSIIAFSYGSKDRHIIEMSLEMRGSDGTHIDPFTFPGYSADLIGDGPINCFAFSSHKELITAMEKLDGLTCYSHNKMSNYDHVMLDIAFKDQRLVLCEEGHFPIIPIALSWQDLALEDQVRFAMDDGALLQPSLMNRIILSQIKGQADFMIESVDPDSVNESMFNGVVNEILKSKPETHASVKPVQAIIVYPSVSILRRYDSKWKEEAQKLNLDVVVVENSAGGIRKHIQRFRPDVILTTPLGLYNLLLNASLIFLRQITHDLKFVYLHQQHRNSSIKSRFHLEFCMRLIPKRQQDGPIIIGHVEQMSQSIKTASQTISYSRGDATSTDQFDFQPVFSRGWNLFCLGPSPSSVIRDLNEQIIQYSQPEERIPQVLRKINQGVTKKRWIILSNNNEHISQLTINLINYFKDETRVTVICNEPDVIRNPNTWDPFIARGDGILIGPYFILDSALTQLCDCIVMFSPPLHDADKVRLTKIATLPNGQRKPVISFCLTSID